MVKPRRNKVATEAFVWRVFNTFRDEFEKRLNKLEKKMDVRFDKVMEHLVDIASKFKKFDEERVILADRSKGHEDRIEKLEDRVFKTS